MRDAKKDLEVCERATKGPWEYELDIQELNVRPGYSPMKIIFYAVKVAGNRVLRFNHENGEADARFIPFAREALPWWINRAQELGAEEERLQGVLRYYICCLRRQESEKPVKEKKYCYGCKHLDSWPDAAGGGTYHCALRPGLVVGEWGHWTDESDKPKELAEDCYEGGGK